MAKKLTSSLNKIRKFINDGDFVSSKEICDRVLEEQAQISFNVSGSELEQIARIHVNRSISIENYYKHLSPGEKLNSNFIFELYDSCFWATKLALRLPKDTKDRMSLAAQASSIAIGQYKYKDLALPTLKKFSEEVLQTILEGDTQNHIYLWVCLQFRASVSSLDDYTSLDETIYKSLLRAELDHTVDKNVVCAILLRRIHFVYDREKGEVLTEDDFGPLAQKRKLGGNAISTDWSELLLQRHQARRYEQFRMELNMLQPYSKY